MSRKAGVATTIIVVFSVLVFPSLLLEKVMGRKKPTAVFLWNKAHTVKVASCWSPGREFDVENYPCDATADDGNQYCTDPEGPWQDSSKASGGGPKFDINDFYNLCFLYPIVETTCCYWDKKIDGLPPCDSRNHHIIRLIDTRNTDYGYCYDVQTMISVQLDEDLIDYCEPAKPETFDQRCYKNPDADVQKALKWLYHQSGASHACGLGKCCGSGYDAC
ncbi:hypothetical protein IE53DRAFT_371680 [Violaceomyces palustris]|uniref:Uncharacterized protein n=1 Tax=Violaceomyces palustris TaxID=1673888 RepID=A0ACD0NN03_9BASI|nr:hypothetical protein IE53DRAFT_371680 [Violaceomyces palustris]